MNEILKLLFSIGTLIYSVLYIIGLFQKLPDEESNPLMYKAFFCLIIANTL